MPGPAGLDIYSNCTDISAFVVTTARDVVVPGAYDVMSEVHRFLCCSIDCARTCCIGRLWFPSDFRFAFQEILPGADEVEIALHRKFRINFLSADSCHQTHSL
jgi:hypothetical protein